MVFLVHLGDIIYYKGTSGSVQCIGDTVVHFRKYQKYIRGRSIHGEDMIITSGDILSTYGDVQYVRGYHDSFKGI